MRSMLVDDGVIADGIAPSYYIEGLLHNLPNPNFVADQSDTVYNILKWLSEPTANGPQFINALVDLWNKWP